jgi:hypothetical protein
MNTNEEETPRIVIGERRVPEPIPEPIPAPIIEPIIQAEWQPLILDENYEINIAPPHLVRNRRTGHIVVECLKPNGYMYLHLNGKNRYKHRIVGTQFIPNPTHLPQIHHKNFQRDDNRIENLEWISARDNNLNKAGYAGRLFNYVDDIPKYSVKVLDFGDWKFKDGTYYFHANKFYRFTHLKFRELHINQTKCGIRFVNMCDTKGVMRCVNVRLLKELYGLV